MKKRVKTWKMIGLSALALAVVLGTATGCQKKADAGTQFKVGLECAYAPFNWTQTTDENGAVKIDSTSYAGGYDVEIAKRVAEGLGRELVIVKTDWDGLLPGVTSGKIDAIIAGMSPTDERRQSIDFTDNYYVSDLVVVVDKNGPYANAKTLADLSGAKITGQLNTFHYSVIDQIPSVDKQTAMEDFPTMITALTSGKVDGYVSERPGAISAIASNPNLTYILFDEGKGFQYAADDAAIAIGVKKDSELTAKINEILSKIPESDRQAMMEAAVKNQPAAN